MANYYQTTQNNSPEDGIIQYRRNVKEMMSEGALTEFQKRSCNTNKRKKKFEMTSEILEGFVGFKFSLF